MSNWNTFTAAPHRMMMFAGSLQLVITLSFWLAELLARYLDILPGITPVIAATWAHGYLMLFGLFPYFIFGFLMTTYPRWMNGPLVERSRYVASFLCMTAGSVVVYVGLFTDTTLLASGILLHMLGWLIGVSELYRVFRAAPGADKSHERFLNLYLLLGGIGMLSFALGAGLDKPTWIQTAMTLGWWGFLLPLLVTVAHRMLPYFSSVVIKPYSVVQPTWVLPALPLLIAGHVACETLNLWQWRFLFDAPLAGIGLYLSFHWGFRRSFQVRLLAILHMAFAWFGIGMALSLRIQKKQARVFVIMGDGEINEGSVWEAAMCAGKHGLEHLTAIVDYNKVQSYGPTDMVQPLEPLLDKWQSFGFETIIIDDKYSSQSQPRMEKVENKPSRLIEVYIHMDKMKCPR